MTLIRKKSKKLNINTTNEKIKCNSVDGFINTVKSLYPVKVTKDTRIDGDKKEVILRVNATYPMGLTVKSNKATMPSGEVISANYAYTFAIVDCVVTVRTRIEIENLLGRLINEWVISKELRDLKYYNEFRDNNLIVVNKLKVGVHELKLQFLSLAGEWVSKYDEEETNNRINPFYIKGDLTKVSHPTLPFVFNDTKKLLNTSLETAVEQEVYGEEFELVKKWAFNNNKVITNTSLFDEYEKEAIWRDTLAITSVISALCKKYEVSWTRLPITRTGCTKLRSKRMVKKFAGKKKREREIAKELTEGTPTKLQLSDLKRSMNGGIAAVNDKYKNVRINETVGHVDYSSFHPSNMMFEKFPIRKNYDLNEAQFTKLLKSRNENKGFIATLEFSDVKLKDGVLLPFKIISEYDRVGGVTLKNGRLETATSLRMTLNAVDFDIFESQYTYESFKFVSAFAFELAFIYKEFRQMLGQLFSDKTKIKNQIRLVANGIVAGNLAELNSQYALGKVSINGQFGLTCQMPIFKTSQFTVTKGYVEQSVAVFVDTDKAYARYKNRNLSFNEKTQKWEYKLNNIYDIRWGTFTSAYSHKYLIKVVNAIGPEAWIKSDTDSAYYVKSLVKDKNFIDNVNNETTERASMAGIPESWYHVDEEFMGHLSVEANLKSFIAKGPKQHQEVFEDGSFEYTNAGISKEALRNAHEQGAFNYDDKVVEIGEALSGLFTVVQTANQPLGETYIGDDGSIGTVDNASGYYLIANKFTIRG